MAGIIGNPFNDDDGELDIRVPIVPNEDRTEDKTSGEDAPVAITGNHDEEQVHGVVNPFVDDDAITPNNDDTTDNDVDSLFDEGMDSGLHVLSPDELVHRDEDDSTHAIDDVTVPDDGSVDDNELHIIDPVVSTVSSLDDSERDVIDTAGVGNHDVDVPIVDDGGLKIVAPVETTSDSDDLSTGFNTDDEELGDDDLPIVIPYEDHGNVIPDDVEEQHDAVGEDEDGEESEEPVDGGIVSSDDGGVGSGSLDFIDDDVEDDNNDVDGNLDVVDNDVNDDVVDDSPVVDDVSVDGNVASGDVDGPDDVDLPGGGGDVVDGDSVVDQIVDGSDDGDGVSSDGVIDGHDDVIDSDDDDHHGLDGWADSDDVPSVDSIIDDGDVESDDGGDGDGLIGDDVSSDDGSFPVGEDEDVFPIDDGYDEEGGDEDEDAGGDVGSVRPDEGGWVDEEPDEYAMPDPGESYPDLSNADPLLTDLLGDDVIEAIDRERGASPKDGGPHSTGDDGGHDDDDSGGHHHEAILADEVGEGSALGDEATRRYDGEIRPLAVERRNSRGRRSRSSGELADGVRIGSARAAERGSVGLAGKLRVHKAIDDPELARKLTIREWKQGKHVRFTKKDIRAMDYLTRWSFATTAQVARAGGWRDRKGDRLTRRFETWDDQGWAHANREFAGPVLWTPTDDGADLGRHKWLGGVSYRRVNPMSQSHSLGLSSLASWLLCGWDDAPDVMHLKDDWKTLRAELACEESFIVSEREIRSGYSKIRSSMRGLLPVEYRCAMLGGVDPGTGRVVDGRFKEFHDRVDSGDAGLDSSPELVACSIGSEGVEQWLWVVWGDWVWNEDPSTGDVSYVPVEDRYDVALNKPRIDKGLGDRFALLDHVPDLVIARRRRDDGSSRSLAVELELKTKDQLSYDRTMASYGSMLGKLLYDKVVWMVPDSTVALAVLRSAEKLGMSRGEDFEIIPFATSERRNSYWTGADMVPAVWGRDNRVVPMIDPDSVLLS